MSSAKVSGQSSVHEPGVEAARPSRLLRFCVWASFVLNTLIIGTGGAVRLTGSGLGCPDWPLCAPGSLVPTEELSYHSLIEFGNRTISGPLLIFAILVLALSIKLNRQTPRRDLVTLSMMVFILVALQAFIGGVIVWLHLNANLVGFHYIVSVILVCLTAVNVVRVYDAPGPRRVVVPKPFLILSHVMTLAMAVTVIFGVLTTANGPHSGDAGIERDGIDATFMSHVHSWPGYITLALVLVLLGWAIAKKLAPLRWNATLLVMLVIQIAVGVYQARAGLPPLAVGVHMVLASLTAAATAVYVMRLKQPVQADAVTA